MNGWLDHWILNHQTKVKLEPFFVPSVFENDGKLFWSTCTIFLSVKSLSPYFQGSKILTTFLCVFFSEKITISTRISTTRLRPWNEKPVMHVYCQDLFPPMQVGYQGLDAYAELLGWNQAHPLATNAVCTCPKWPIAKGAMVGPWRVLFLVSRQRVPLVEPPSSSWKVALRAILLGKSHWWFDEPTESVCGDHITV